MFRCGCVGIAVHNHAQLTCLMVQVTYDKRSHWLQRWVMAPLNQLLLRWVHRVAPHPEHPRVTERLDSRVASGKAAATLPLAVACGTGN